MKPKKKLSFRKDVLVELADLTSVNGGATCLCTGCSTDGCWTDECGGGHTTKTDCTITTCAP